MASSIGNGGYHIPNHGSKVGHSKPAANNVPSQDAALPGDSSDINFGSLSAPVFKPTNEKAEQIDLGAKTAAPKSAAPAAATSSVPRTMAMEDIGSHLLTSSNETSLSDMINSSRQFITDGKLQGLSLNYQASFSPGSMASVFPGNSTLH